MAKNIIITHDGQFHADEVLACVLFKKFNPLATIIHTRNVDFIQLLTKTHQVIAIVDVLGEYIPRENKFDHHQRGFDTHINGVKCSSASLVFKHFSKEILLAYNIATNCEDRLIKEIYLQYFRAVDAIDNGIDISSTVDISGIRNCVEYDLGHNINSNCTDDNTVHMRTISNMVESCGNFEEAFCLVGNDFGNFMTKMTKWINSYERVARYLRDIDSNGSLITNEYRRQILLTENMANVGKIVCEIEKEKGMDIKYTIDERNGKFTVYAVPVAANAFETKKLLNEKWRGLRDKKLYQASLIEGIKFVHLNGYLGVSKTLQGALEMCYQSIQ